MSDELLDTLTRLQEKLRKLNSIVVSMDIQMELQIVRGYIKHHPPLNHLYDNYTELRSLLEDLESQISDSLEEVEEIKDGYKEYLGEE